MGVVNSNKEINKTTIDCGETFNITLSITATPDIVSNPTDIVLVLDRSGSMAGSPLLNLKNGAKKFVEIIDEATDSTQDGQIGNGSHIGIVSFSNIATKDTKLITSVEELDMAIDALSAGGLNNHTDAFTKATELFDMTSSNAKVIVMFTEGVTTVGGDATPIAELAKSQGIIIYCIGLSGDTGLDVNALNAWSSDPDSAYVAITPDDTQLEDLFEELAKNISKPGATLEFSVKHVGTCTGTVEANESIEYEDAEGSLVLFENPTIEIDCDEQICLEECPTPIDITISGCNDTVEYDAGNIYLDSLGRILELNGKIKNVCPNRRVALAVVLTEVDSNNIEHKRGMKTMVIPAHSHLTCRDIKINCIRFVLPEELDVSECESSICNNRNFKARFIAHYIDNDFDGCNDLV